MSKASTTTTTLVNEMSMYMNTRVIDPRPDELNSPECAGCGKSMDANGNGNTSTNSGVKLKRCSRCHDCWYCGKECQTADWPNHKPHCIKCTTWYDKHRKCKDGSVHEGILELITWAGERNGVPLGWGASFENESGALREIFEQKFGRDVQRFFGYRPQAFRWTCCGNSAKLDYGCDHHGEGKQPCTCDFCRMGKPIPDKIYNERLPSKIGLKLPRGPDPRSYNAAYAASVAVGRKMWNMEG